jgi:uncharacterized membrane protein HdeD (DUF308 family)
MNGFTWQHVAVVGIGALVAGLGAFAPPVAATALIAMGSGLATGAVGHAQGNKERGVK